MEALREPLPDGVDVRRVVAASRTGPVVKVRVDRLDDDAEGWHQAAFDGDGLVAQDVELPVSWQRVQTAADVGLAEQLLIRSLTKASDGVVSRHINRRISGAVSRRLAPLPAIVPV